MTYTAYLIGYISAWLDTDGFLSVRVGKTNKCFGKIIPIRKTYQPLIGFVNTNRAVLEYLQHSIAQHGIIQEIEQKPSTKILCRLVYIGQQAVNLLRELNLVGKAKQQRLLLELGQLKFEAKLHYEWQHDKARWARRVLRYQEIADLVKELNSSNGGTEYYL